MNDKEINYYYKYKFSSFHLKGSLIDCFSNKQSLIIKNWKYALSFDISSIGRKCGFILTCSLIDKLLFSEGWEDFKLCVFSFSVLQFYEIIEFLITCIFCSDFSLKTSFWFSSFVGLLFEGSIEFVKDDFVLKHPIDFNCFVQIHFLFIIDLNLCWKKDKNI